MNMTTSTSRSLCTEATLGNREDRKLPGPGQHGGQGKSVNWRLVRHIALTTLCVARRGGLDIAPQVPVAQAVSIRCEMAAFPKRMADPRDAAAVAAAVYVGLSNRVLQVAEESNRRQVASLVRYHLLPALHGVRVAPPPVALMRTRQWKSLRVAA